MTLPLLSRDGEMIEAIHVAPGLAAVDCGGARFGFAAWIPRRMDGREMDRIRPIVLEFVDAIAKARVRP